MGDEVIPAIYSPGTGKIACVLIQAGMGGRSAIAQFFPVEQWFTFPEDDMIMMGMTRDQWKRLAEIPQEERIQRWKRLAEAGQVPTLEPSSQRN